MVFLAGRGGVGGADGENLLLAHEVVEVFFVAFQVDDGDAVSMHGIVQFVGHPGANVIFPAALFDVFAEAVDPFAVFNVKRRLQKLTQGVHFVLQGVPCNRPRFKVAQGVCAFFVG